MFKRKLLGLLILGTTGCGGNATPPPNEASAGEGGAAGGAGAPDVIGEGGDAGETPGAGGSQGGEAGTGGLDMPIVPVVESTGACLLNADCPSGQHCDLGECVQRCNEETPCEDGTICSVRGRCLPEGAVHAEDEPPVGSEGTISAEPSTVFLDAEQRSLRIKLSSTSSKSVHYRVETSAGHLRAREPRGEFTGETTIEIEVDPTAVNSENNSGAIRVVTNLGEIAVVAPIVPGLSGYYQGTMRYESGALSLGEAAIGIEMVQTDTELAVRVDPRASLLFPEAVPAADPTAATTAAMGSGSYAKADGLVEATVHQRLPRGFAGTRNGFNRPVLRSTRFQLSPGVGGTLQGTFTEEITGISTQALTLSGTVLLTYQTDRSVSEFTPPTGTPERETPTLGDYLPPRDVFGWTGDGGVFCGPVAESGCSLLADDQTACRASVPEYADALSAALVQALYDDMAAPARSAAPFATMAENCRAALNLGDAATVVDLTTYEASDAARCALVAPLACLLEAVARDERDAVGAGRTFSETVARLVSPGLLVAKEELSQALSASFTSGLNAESEHYDLASDALSSTLEWLLQPEVVEHLFSMPEEGARGAGVPGSTTIVLDSFPAARALGELFSVLSVIDGERARVAGASDSSENAQLRLTQERAVIALLEAATFGRMVSGWPSAPSTLGARFTGFLNPINRGFASLGSAGGALGIPRGFVPFVYRPEDVANAGPTNFEQMLFLAEKAVGAQATAEEAWLLAGRSFEENQQEIRDELASVRQTFDLRLRQICGPSFNPSQADPSDPELCPDTGTGELSQRRAEAAQASQALASARSRVEHKRTMAQISIETAARVLGVRNEQIELELANGEKLRSMALLNDVRSAAVKGLEIAANAQLWNAGLPLAMGMAAAKLELANAEADYARNELVLLQTASADRASSSVEYLNAMANVKRELVEIEQLVIEIQDYVLALLSAQIEQRTLLDQARALLEERALALASGATPPSSDPAFRLLRDRTALDVLHARRKAQEALLLAGRALQYELNMSLGSLDGSVLGATNALSLSALTACYESIHDGHRIAYGSPQEYVTTISLRELVGITGRRTDEVTGEELSAGRQFREHLLTNQNFDERGALTFTFGTTLNPDNGLWSSDLCSDRIESVEAALIGEDLGDDEAQLNLSLGGTSLFRGCGSDSIDSWALGAGTSSGDGSAVAVLQAGVNDYGSAAANTSLFGQSVARATWRVSLPTGSAAPSNSDVDLERIDDIRLRVTHRALARRTNEFTPDLSCLR